ncbi:hypothetical protein CUR178_02787 [Leishmania enriettii]|uniref:Uncharacterized protein n=1 Tax=Leishmania enriettii TaxID=5663 RepID=A0A836KIQ3_LEIEN|nr:hypothetical protein CUR178_02787 [Leishmania enriettii]
MPSNTESSGFTDGDRPMSAGASALHMAQPSGTAASDRYASAPFLLQARFSRAAQPTEILAADTPPSSGRPHIRPQLLPQRLPLGKHGFTNTPEQSRMPAAIGAARPGGSEAEMGNVAGQQNSSAVTGEASVSSAACVSDSYALLANLRDPLLSYTWTDSYLDESPSTTKARWMRQRTFGPVVQSEGGGSSTVSSTPRGTCNSEGIWDGIHARNAAARDSAAEAAGNQQYGDDDEPKWSPTDSDRARTWRFDLLAAKTREEGLGVERLHRGEDDHFGIDRLERHTTRMVAASLFPLDEHSVSTCTSNASTMIATVQQPRRVRLIAPIEKPQHLPTAEAAISTADGVRLRSAREKGGATSSPAGGDHFQGVNLSSGCRNMVPASRAFSPRRTVNIAGTNNAQTSCPPSANRSQSEHDGTGGKFSTAGQRYGNPKASRCSPPRGRVLKVIYDD